jgi:midasin
MNLDKFHAYEEKVCQAHRDLLDPLSLSSCLAYIETCNWRSSEDNFAVKDYPVLRLQSGVPESHYFRDIVKNYMNPGLKSVHDSLKQGPEKLADGAAAWIYIFTCCLKIYVPDRPFDPALKPYVERDRYHRRQAELLVKLDALQSFQMLLTGQPKSLRSHIVQHKLEKLGDEPHAIAVPRPRVSEISKLCGEFKNLLDSVVSRCPDGSVLSSLFDGDVTRQQELELLRSNISRVITRISSGFAAYEDITKPLVAMLHGLDVGLAMALLASPTSSWSGSDIRQVSTSTPFLGMQISYYSQPGLHAAESTSAHDLNSRIKFLKNMAVYRSVNQEITPSVSQKMCEIFHSIYEDWRGRMEKDKHHKELLSSMYHYRGVESNDTCSDDNSFLDLFPDLLETGEKLGDGDKSQPDQRSLAQELAVCHKDIFQSDKSTSHFTLTILEDAAEKIGRLWLNNLDANACDVPTDETACAVLLGLSNHHTRLNDLSVAPKTYNFYADANLAEVSNLVNIVSKVQTRFTYLTEVWPEHATVKNVLQTSCELMAFSHVEPIAKVLTKTEQLHVFLHEWQAVASKEYTAITLYDQITNLLIGWRRLELSTWAQLLDMEDRKSNDDVDSWWFVAYEAIIAVPLSMISSGENIQPYSQQLFATLGEFLTTSTIGQFSRRLRLVECFKGHVKLVALEAHSFKIIHDTLLNFLSFYEPYEKNIQETLHERRRNLEKDVKEVVLLASWKDTNINALRESAKRSHNKLFKIIRKYRTILAQPAKDLIGGKILEKITMSEQCVENSTEQTLLVDSKAIEINKQCLPYWGLKPVRFTDPSSTAKKMKSMAQLAPDMLGCALSLQDIAADLVRNIDILQNETPRKAKKEDERAAKHLKTRKRKLFSETLRKIRHMGFQPNLSSSKLDQQASSAAVLGKCPSMPPVTGSIRFRDADFHRLLRLMPQARESFRNHSSDLTAREISRSIGYLESILMLTIKQRSKIITGLWELNRLDEIICMIQNLWAPEKYTLQRDKSWQSCAAKDQEKVIKWLPGIVAAGSILVKKYDDLTGHDSSAVIKALEGWQKQLEVSVKAYDCIPTLPFGVSSSVHETTHHQAKHLLSEFKAYLQESRIENANLSFIWKQIDLWTEVNKTALDPQTEDELPISLTEVDKVISEACDSIMVAMQRMKNIMSSYSSAEEGSNWLFVTDTLFVNCLSVFQPSRMMSVLGDALSRTSHVEANDESGLVAIGAIWATALPIIQQYRNSLKDCVGHYANFQQALCRLASMLADVFCRIASQGFCNPPEDSETPAGTTEKLEEGTGLGEGEGEKDISKDIKNDEDLSELAQQGDKDMASDIDDQEGAVNMDYDELEGEIEDVPEEDQTHRDANEGEESNIDDEMGDVDDLDPSAIDEKLWDGKPEETSKEKEDSKQTGKSPKPEQMAAESEIPDGSDKDHRSEENEMSESNFEENEQVVHGESEKLDPHLQEEQNLDLPEGLNFNDDDHLSADSPSDFSSVEGDSVADTEESKDEIAHDNIDDISSSEDAATTEEMLRPPNNEGDESMSVNGTEEAASPVDMETTETEGGSGHDRLRDHTMDANTDPTNEPTNGDQGYAADDDQRNEDQQNEGMNDRAIEGGKGDSSVNDKLTASGNGYLGQNNEGMKEDNDEEEQIENKSGNPAFKKLGDALERWHKRQREIRNGQTQEKELQDNKNEVDMSGQEFEHLNGELEAADAQALGAATWDQAQALNAQALESQMQDQPADLGSEENAVEGPAGEHFEIFPLKNEENQDLSRLGAIIVDDSTREHVLPKDSTGPSEKLEADIDDLGTDLTTTHLYSAQLLSQRTFSEASRLWAHYESLTHSLSLSLTEQLRLILAPTLATKMRGDFRTGKRLNIKRIIPYIASNYKRDKIWMRRSIPSKRAYQILLSVDDSKSMSESHGGHLALQTLALVAKSLSMLEAGEMCIVGFGTEVRVAHPFDRPFSSDAGPAALRNFNFQQPHTDVKKLLQASLALFRDARLKSARSGTTDLWQLQLIISDGVCEDHDAIRRLMRSAQQERIVIVFIILDAGKGESILDMSQAVFELDSSEQDGLRIPGNASADGIDARPTKLRIKRYLDGFPFPYYLVVGDVKELPGVLATALRQWFAEVVESG